jgi:hypothetical protein
MPRDWLRAILRQVRDPEIVERPNYAYKVVSVERMEGLQALLDQHSVDGWRLVHTVSSDGYSVALIFERET